MDQFGTILENAGGQARVLVRRPGACAHCGACELGSRAEQVIELPNPDGYAPGTSVRLVVAEGEVARASFLVYVVPLLALFAGFGLGEYLGRLAGHPSDLLVAGAGLACLVLAYVALAWWDRRRAPGRCAPRMEAVQSGPEAGGD
jgi:sigma-E factor negative regulatory protein RseC